VQLKHPRRRRRRRKKKKKKKKKKIETQRNSITRACSRGKYT
jgi:hypothetical protein